MPSVEVHIALTVEGPPQATPIIRPMARSPDGLSATEVMPTANVRPARFIGLAVLQFTPSADEADISVLDDASIIVMSIELSKAT
jgi:hypothetical protein